MDRDGTNFKESNLKKRYTSPSTRSSSSQKDIYTPSSLVNTPTRRIDENREISPPSSGRTSPVPALRLDLLGDNSSSRTSGRPISGRSDVVAGDSPSARLRRLDSSSKSTRPTSGRFESPRLKTISRKDTTQSLLLSPRAEKSPKRTDKRLARTASRIRGVQGVKSPSSRLSRTTSKAAFDRDNRPDSAGNNRRRSNSGVPSDENRNIFFAGLPSDSSDAESQRMPAQGPKPVARRKIIRYATGGPVQNTSSKRTVNLERVGLTQETFDNLTANLSEHDRQVFLNNIEKKIQAADAAKKEKQERKEKYRAELVEAHSKLLHMEKTYEQRWSRLDTLSKEVDLMVESIQQMVQRRQNQGNFDIQIAQLTESIEILETYEKNLEKTFSKGRMEHLKNIADGTSALMNRLEEHGSTLMANMRKEMDQSDNTQPVSPQIASPKASLMSGPMSLERVRAMALEYAKVNMNSMLGVSAFIIVLLCFIY